MGNSLILLAHFRNSIVIRQIIWRVFRYLLFIYVTTEMEIWKTKLTLVRVKVLNLFQNRILVSPLCIHVKIKVHKQKTQQLCQQIRLKMSRKFSRSWKGILFIYLFFFFQNSFTVKWYDLYFILKYKLSVILFDNFIMGWQKQRC